MSAFLPGMYTLLLQTALLAAGAATGDAVTSLPVMPAGQSAGLDALSQSGRWWAQVGNSVVHAPEADTGLSPHAKDYYYAYGSHKSLPVELLQKRVGGEGRVHIFHLPGGQGSLNATLPHKAGRRAAMSALVQVKHKSVLSDGAMFPAYPASSAYESPLSSAGQQLEKRVVEALTSTAVMNELKQLTELTGNPSFGPSRSWSDAKATEASVKFITEEFEGMGYTTCLQTSEKQGHSLVSIVAYLPGSGSSSEGTVTLGGHYDSRPFTGPAPGAVDNGSGAAAVLSVARAVAAASTKPRRGVFFVAFAAEEPGLWGSEEFSSRIKMLGGQGGDSVSFLEGGQSFTKSAMCGQQGGALLQNQAARGKKMRSHEKAKHEALILDEVAWKSPNLDGQMVVNLESYDWSSHVLENLAQSSLTHNGADLVLTHSSHPFGSDHMSFLDKGMQAVLSIHGDDEKYPHYHKSSDTIDNVDPALYTMIVKMNAGALLRLAGADA